MTALIPRKLSVDDAEAVRFYETGIVIKLNGIEVHDVVEYDIDAGYLVKHVIDENDQLVKEGDKLKLEKLEGEIEVSLPHKRED